MNPNKTQIIYKNGDPAFAIVPYDKYLRLTSGQPLATVPPEVIKLSQSMTLVKAWRIHLKMTQGEIASQLGIAQSTYCHFENNPSPNLGMLRRIAAAMDLDVDQLIE